LVEVKELPELPETVQTIHCLFLLMARYVIKAFGITREILGTREKLFETDGNTVASLRAALVASYPTLGKLPSLMIAVNNTYAEDGDVVAESDEIALIPPVSGG
jgi:molybdopterin converting factor subunit 1